MTNRLLLIVLSASTLLLGACNTSIDISFDQESVDGSGVITTETYNLSGFTEIEVCCSLDVEVVITDDNSESVEIETDNNLHSRMKVEVTDGDTLSIKPESNSLNLRSTGPIIVRISGSDVNSIRGRAATSLTGVFPTTDTFSVRADAASMIDVSIDTDEADVSATSASDVTVSGRADQLTVSANSSGTADLSALAAIDTEIDASSASTLKINSSNSVSGKASSAASVEVRGGADNASVDVSSGASVEYGP